MDGADLSHIVKLASLQRLHQLRSMVKPLYIRMIEKFKIDSDRGIGDTLHRILPDIRRLGININCGCDRRAETLNKKYPYTI